MSDSNRFQLPADIDLKTWQATRVIVKKVIDQMKSERITSSQRLVAFVLRFLGEPIEAFSKRPRDEQDVIVRRISIALERARRDTVELSRSRRLGTIVGATCETHFVSSN